MENREVVIEQLFEDLPSDVFSSGSKPETSDKSKSGKEVRTRKSSIISSGSKTTSFSKSLPSIPDNEQVSSSSKTTSTMSSVQSSPVGTSRPKSKTAKGDKRSSASSSSHTKPPFSPASALSMYKDKLTKHEMTEIQNYTHIYYVGIGAKKIQACSATEDNGFDDDENFYRVVPRDHIAFRYEVAEKPTLGKGTFGEVVKAYDHKEKRMVAIKLVRNERIYLKQSREELRILQALRKQDSTGSHNIVHIFDFFMFRSHMCFVFELLGMNLYQVLRRNQYRGLGTAKILLIARSVLKCLELLFKNRIIHCDIKPENIMLRRNGDFTAVKVGDFGSSCYEQQQVYHYIQSRYYRAPEVLLGMRYGPAIDMWSFGCVLGELSSGYPLFVGADEDDQLAAIEEVLGSVPAQMMARKSAKRRGISRRPSRGRPGSKSLTSLLSGDDHFKDFVAAILTWDPVIRPTPVEIQEHRWLKVTSKTVLPSTSHPGTISSSYKMNSASNSSQNSAKLS